GGGGNFGVVTAFEYDLYPVGPEVFFLGAFFPIAAAQPVLRHLRDWMPEMPEAFSPLAVIGHIPEAPGFPEEHHGAPMIAVVGPWIGEAGEGERVLAPLRRLAEPIADVSGTMPFLEVQQFFDEDYPSGGRYYWKSTYLTGLSDEVVEALVALND